jgi:hypothetical protein
MLIEPSEEELGGVHKPTALVSILIGFPVYLYKKINVHGPPA